MSMDKFSLSKHILSHLNNFLTESESESMNPTEHELLCYLLKIKRLVKIWEPVNTAGTIYELSNLIKNFDSVWLEIQKFYLQSVCDIFITAVTAESQFC